MQRRAENFSGAPAGLAASPSRFASPSPGRLISREIITREPSPALSPRLISREVVSVPRERVAPTSRLVSREVMTQPPAATAQRFVAPQPMAPQFLAPQPQQFVAPQQQQLVVQQPIVQQLRLIAQEVMTVAPPVLAPLAVVLPQPRPVVIEEDIITTTTTTTTTTTDFFAPLVASVPLVPLFSAPLAVFPLVALPLVALPQWTPAVLLL
jgi:hypothetical protein